MTPNNIINMAVVNRLDIIAVTDHNSSLNTPALQQCAEGKPLVFVPGIEVESAEEVHISCLFPDIASALSMGRIVKGHLFSPENNEEIFGEQLVCDENDRIIGREKGMLLFPTDMTAKEIFDFAWNLGGISYFSHVDRSSYGVLSVLGVFPDNIRSEIAEISDNACGREFAVKRKELAGKTILFCSDAHRLSDISRGTNFIDLPVERDVITASEVIRWLRHMSREVCTYE